ncbi:phosphoribosylaminoimidazole carboxylase [Cyathus striatus]|nr:phosphoribosylaminoimidazole carboxylase [Cyathus striatus]
MSSKVVGILGERGGQLGRMLASSASLLNISIVILDVGPNAPAKQILSPLTPSLAHIDGSFSSASKISELASKVDILTIEIEHVDAQALIAVQQQAQRDGRKLEIHPSPETIQIIQDKYTQKEHLRAHGCAVGPYLPLECTTASVQGAIETLGLPIMLKSRTLAYDGRGNFLLHSSSPEAIQSAIEALGNRPLYAEKYVPFEREIAVMVVRSASGEVKSYPAVETVHKDNICHLVYAPLRSVDGGLGEKAKRIAEDAVRTFTGAGVFGVEMFLLGDGTVYINEIAPRPHNSGHYTIEACHTSQYANHLRAILNLPLGSTSLKVPCAAMLNLIGHSNSMTEINTTVAVALSTPGAEVHLYGKSECRKGRKMGHITITASSDAELHLALRPLLLSLPTSSSEDLPIPQKGHSHPHPLVSIIMGSDSDLPVMLPCARILDQFAIPYELTIVSAHRTPGRLVEFAKGARGRGVRVVVAGAGGAAHLPGMVAAVTELPVVGVPVRGSVLEGLDSLFSIVQMPRGIPVATVAINNSTNAALLAIRILGSSMPELADRMAEYMRDMEREVLGKVERVEELGWEGYVDGMRK